MPAYVRQEGCEFEAGMVSEGEQQGGHKNKLHSSIWNIYTKEYWQHSFGTN